MPKKLSSAALDAYRRDGYYFPVPALDGRRGGALSRLSGKARGQDRRAPAGELAAQGAPALHLGRRTCTSPQDRRRGRGRAGSQSSLLDHQLLHQGGEQPRFRVVASGCVLLGPQQGRRDDRMGCAVAGQPRERLHEIPARLADAGSPRSTSIPSTRTICSRADRRLPSRSTSENTVDCILNPGEMSLHHVKLVHGSEPNRSNDRRIGLAIRYIPTDVKQLKVRDLATLVRGVDATTTSITSRVRSAISTKRRLRPTPTPSAGRSRRSMLAPTSRRFAPDTGTVALPSALPSDGSEEWPKNASV